MLNGYRTIGQVNKQMVTQRMSINLSASPYSAAEETGTGVIWAGYAPLGHNHKILWEVNETRCSAE